MNADGTSSASESTRPSDAPEEAPARRNGTLVGQVASRIGIGTLVIVLLTGAAGYWLTFAAFEEQELARLEDYVAEKGRAESTLFRTAEEEVAAFGELFVELYARAPAELAEDFERYFDRGPEGAWRTRPDLHQGVLTEEGEYFERVTGFIGSNVESPDIDLRRRVVIALRLAARLGPATDPSLVLHASFPENAIVVYSEDPWGLTARADLDMTGQSVIGSTLQAANPERTPIWTSLYYDLTAETWAITYQLPVDHDGRHLVNPSHDVRLTGLLERFLDERMAGTHNLILTAGGDLIAHPDRLDEVQQENGQLSLEELGDPVLLDRYERIRQAGPIREGTVSVIDDAAHDAYLGVTRLHGPDWWWVTVYPKDVVAASAHRAARLIVGLGIAFFLLVMGVVYWALQRTVAGPIGTLTRASSVIGQGDYARIADGLLPLPEDNPNEIGLLARTFRRMARRLRDTRELDDAVFLIDADGLIHEANPAAARQTGYSMAELAGMDLFELDASSDPELRRVLGRLRPDESERLGTRHRHRDGETIPVEVVVRAFETPQGRRFLATARDISERIRQEEERLRLERELMDVQRSESLGQLAGGVAHDFNNILAAVLGNAELALEEVQPGSPEAQMLDEIRTSATRAAALANQMLAYAGKGQFDVRSVSLSEIVREAAGLTRSSMPSHVELDLQLDDDVPAIRADPTQMHQVATNLLMNAWEAIGDGHGRVTARTYGQDLSAADLEANRTGEQAVPGSYVILDVEDTGPGFDEETATRIFEPFFTTKFTGRGLGLAALLGIVRAHDGAVLVDATPGEGARFRVALPAADGAPTTVAAADHQDGSAARSGRVLVVDDEPVVLDVAARMLQRLGFETLTAGGGAEAIRAFREDGDEIDVVLLDLSMPGIDGVDVYHELREIDADVRIVMTSGYGEDEVTAQLAELTVSGFVQKPFSLEELGRALSGSPGSRREDR